MTICHMWVPVRVDLIPWCSSHRVKYKASTNAPRYSTATPEYRFEAIYLDMTCPLIRSEAYRKLLSLYGNTIGNATPH